MAALINVMVGSSLSTLSIILIVAGAIVALISGIVFVIQIGRLQVHSRLRTAAFILVGAGAVSSLVGIVLLVASLFSN